MDKLAAIARAARYQPLPSDTCPKCYHSFARSLLTGHCICTGDVRNGRPDMSGFFHQ